MNDNAIVVRPDGEIVERERPMNVEEVTALVRTVEDIIANVMKEGTDYGTIPGCGKKPVLFQSGAEKLSMAFGLLPRYKVEIRELGGGHREYLVTCTLEGRDGGFRGQGVGSCSTLESKYRYRNTADYEILDTPIPKDSKERKAEYRRQGFGMKQVDGAWFWVKYTTTGKVENPDIADMYNTCLKMATKRSFVKGTITATGSGHRLTQDIEDNPEAFGGRQPAHDDRPPIAAPVEAPTPPDDGMERITPEQARALWKILSACRGKKAEEQWRAKLADHKLESTNHLPAAEYEAALKWIRGEQGPEDKW